MFYASLVLCLWTLIGVFGDEVTLVSVMEGDNVTLHTNFTEIKDEIKWFFKDILIGRIKKSWKLIPKYEDNDVTQRFGDRLMMNTQNGDLNIISITPQDSGCYKVINVAGNNLIFKVIVNAVSTVSIASSTVSTVSSTFRITVPPKKPSGGPQPNYMTMIYCAAAAGCLLIVVVVLIIWIYRKHKNKHQQDQTGEDEITYADTTFYKRKTQTKRVKNEDDVVYAGIVTKR
nr:uncharacterized protein LOC129453913 isoform X2 [Misgurnus anguillicaudatus]